MGRQKAPTCPASAASGTHPWARAVPPPDFGSLSQHKECLDSDKPPVSPQPSPSSEPRTALHEHSTASSGSSPCPHLRASTSALFSKHSRHSYRHALLAPAGLHGMGAIPPSAPGAGVLLQPRAFCPLGFQPPGRGGGSRPPCCGSQVLLPAARTGSAPPGRAAAPSLCQGGSQSSLRAPRPCHRATARGPCPPLLSEGLAWSSRAGCRWRGAEGETNTGRFLPAVEPRSSEPFPGSSPGGM